MENESVREISFRTARLFASLTILLGVFSFWPWGFEPVPTSHVSLNWFLPPAETLFFVLFGWAVLLLNSNHLYANWLVRWLLGTTLVLAVLLVMRGLLGWDWSEWFYTGSQDHMLVHVRNVILLVLALGLALAPFRHAVLHLIFSFLAAFSVFLGFVYFLLGVAGYSGDALLPAPLSISMPLLVMLAALSFLALLAPFVHLLRVFIVPTVQVRLFWALFPIFIAMIVFDVLVHASFLLKISLYDSGLFFFETVVSSLLYTILIGLAIWFIGRRMEQSHLSLVQSEAKFRNVVEQAYDGVVVLDSNGDVFIWNESMTQITGLRAADVMGSHARVVIDRLTPAEYRDSMIEQRIKKFLGDILFKKRLPAFPLQIYIRPVNTRQNRIINCTFSIIRNGTDVQYCATLRDITAARQAEDELEWRFFLEQSLAAVYELITRDNLSLPQLANLVLETGRDLTESAAGFVTVIDQHTGSNVGYAVTEQNGVHERMEFPRNADGSYSSLWGYALNKREPFYTNDAFSHPASRHGYNPEHIMVKKFLSVPVMLGDRLVGQIGLANPGRDYCERDLQAIVRMGEFYALALQRMESQDALSLRLSQLMLLSEGQRQLSQLLDEARVLETAVNLVSKTFNFYHAGIFLYNETSNMMRLVAYAGAYQGLFEENHTIHLGVGLVGTAARLRYSVVSNDVSNDPHYFSHAPGKTNTRSELCVPILRDDVLIGVLDVQSPRLNAFDDNGVSVMETLASQVSIALETARLYKQVRQELQERTAAENALRVSEGRYRQLYESMHEGFALHEPLYDENGDLVDFRYVQINPAFETITGKSVLEVVGHTVLEAFPSLEPDFMMHYRQVTLTGQSETFEIQSERLGKYFRVSAFRLDGGYTANLFVDVTRMKQDEKKLKMMLAEKEVLLKEIHHRVKNNLQVIISLLSLRSDSLQDAQALRVFQDCQDSVRAIALIHERIYQTENLVNIDTAEYIPSLLGHLLGIYAENADKVRVHVNVESIALDLDSAIPCGLIVTELFTNALKHAFPEKISPRGEPDAQLWIELGKQDDGYRLVVRDNGIGLVPGFSIQNTTSLGLQLVEILVRKLDGSIHIEQKDGVSFILSFPYPVKEREVA